MCVKCGFDENKIVISNPTFFADSKGFGIHIDKHPQEPSDEELAAFLEGEGPEKRKKMAVELVAWALQMARMLAPHCQHVSEILNPAQRRAQEEAIKAAARAIFGDDVVIGIVDLDEGPDGEPFNPNTN